jgi:hypothetical protein
MNARASENYLAISRPSSASKSVEIFWAEIYWGRLIFRAESKWGCHGYNLLILSWIISSNNIELYSINKIMGASLICDYWELEFPYWNPSYSGKDYLPSLTLLCGIIYSTLWMFGISCRIVSGHDTSSCDVTKVDHVSWINNVSDSSQHRALLVMF